MNRLKKQELLFIILTAVLFVIGRLGVLICAALAAIILVALSIFHARIPKGFTVLIIVYTFILFAAMLSSFNKGQLLSIGYILFTISDAMLAIKTAFPKMNAYMSHIVLAVYYVAVILITLRIQRES